MSRGLTIATGALLVLALVQAGALALRQSSAPSATLPLLLPEDPPGALQSPGEAERVLEARAVTLGDYLTVEDLARGVLLLQQGELDGAPPLTEAEREAVNALLAQADAHRTELLELEAELRAVDASLGEVAAELAASLTPEQRAWVVTQRDRVSVGEVERAYWDAVLEATASPDAP